MQATQYYPPRTRRVNRRTQRAIIRTLAWAIGLIIREVLA